MSMGNKCKHGRAFAMVTQRNCNHSAFNGYHRTPSDYSSVRCIACGAHYRSKAAFVSTLPDAPDGWVNMSAAEIAAALGIALPPPATKYEDLKQKIGP